MNKRIGQTGFSLAELSATVALAAVGMLLIAEGSVNVMKAEKESSTKREVNVELARALNDVLKVGRIAQECRRLLLEIPETTDPDDRILLLECRVDRNIPPTADSNDDETYRFGRVCHYDVTPIVCQFEWGRRDANGRYPTYVSYSGITGFQVCDEAQMHANECPIGGQNAYQRYVASTLPSTASSRYFRFLLMSEDADSTRHQGVQSAFWVRHPTPAGFMYQWGQRWK